MAGVKGMKGGGGARMGAGRRKKPESALKVELEAQPHGGALKRSTAQSVPMSERDMLELLQDVALGRIDATSLQVRAAIAAVQYTHTKRSDGGKKEEQAGRAEKAVSKFALSTAPRLVSSR